MSAGSEEDSGRGRKIAGSLNPAERHGNALSILEGSNGSKRPLSWNGSLDWLDMKSWSHGSEEKSMLSDTNYLVKAKQWK